MLGIIEMGYNLFYFWRHFRKLPY